MMGDGLRGAVRGGRCDLRATATERIPSGAGGGISQPRSRRQRSKLDTYGRHIICELSGCEASALVDVQAIRTVMVEAARVAKAEVREAVFHQFIPEGVAGVSGVVVLSESHISIHTWPERGYAAIDVYTCGHQTSPRLACEYLSRVLGAGRMFITEMTRGIPSLDGQYTHVAAPEAVPCAA